MRLDAEEFEELVSQAVESLPADIRQKLDNVALMIEDYPTRQQLRLARIGRGATLLGLYEGIPLTGRTSAYNMVMPDRITIFREPILAICRTPDQVRQTVAHTIRHEIAHHFGISDEHLRSIGRY